MSAIYLQLQMDFQPTVKYKMCYESTVYQYVCDHSKNSKYTVNKTLATLNQGLCKQCMSTQGKWLQFIDKHAIYDIIT